MALKHRIALVFWLAWALAVGAGLHAVNVWWGNLNQDEGWYLLAARAASRGLLPYADFAFTQGPLMPAVYSAFQPLVDRYGLAGARVATAALGMAASVLALLAAARSARRGGGLIAATLAATLLLVNVYHSYFSVIVKTYSLASLFLMVGLLAMVNATDRRKAAWSFAAGAFIALASGVRFSLGIALPIVGLFLLARRRSLGDRHWLLFGVGGAAALAAVFAPHLLGAAEGLRFGLLDFHGARDAGSVSQLLVYKLGFASRFVQAYMVFTGLAIMGWVFRNRLPGSSDAARDVGPASWNPVFWLVGFALSAVHFAAPFPYDDYQVVAFPLLAVALAVSLANRLVTFAGDSAPDSSGGAPGVAAPWAARFCGGLFLIGALAAGSSPMVQDWVVLRRDRIWWQLKEEPDIQRLRHAAALLRSRASAGSVLLTQDAYLAVEGGFEVPAGLEMGPFSYFPGMDDAQAQRLRVLNRGAFRSLLAGDRFALAAVSGYTAAIASPAIAPVDPDERAELLGLLDAHYRPFARLADFGQAHTELRLYERKPAGP